MILDDTATVCHVMHREGFRTRASVHDGGKEGVAIRIYWKVLCRPSCNAAYRRPHAP